MGTFFKAADGTLFDWPSNIATLVEAGVAKANARAAVAAELAKGYVAELDAVRGSVFTGSPSGAVSMMYQAQEARRYKDAGYPGTVSEADYPFLFNRIGPLNVTKRDLADDILAKEAALTLKAAQVATAIDEVEVLFANAADPEAQSIADQAAQIVAAAKAVATA